MLLLVLLLLLSSAEVLPPMVEMLPVLLLVQLSMW